MLFLIAVTYMTTIEEQYKALVETFPNLQLVKDSITRVRIPIVNDAFIEIDYSNYPKRPKATLIKSNGKSFKNLDMIVGSLKSWNKSDPILIVDLVKEIQNLIQDSDVREVKIKYELLEGILGLCKTQHPREILGMLRVERGVIVEYILPPGASTSANSGVFSPSRLPYDMSIEGTVHSHPSGNSNPSPTDLQQVFRRHRFHLIVGYPYNTYNVKCFDPKGNEINLVIVP